MNPFACEAGQKGKASASTKIGDDKPEKVPNPLTVRLQIDKDLPLKIQTTTTAFNKCMESSLAHEAEICKLQSSSDRAAQLLLKAAMSKISSFQQRFKMLKLLQAPCLPQFKKTCEHKRRDENSKADLCKFTNRLQYHMLRYSDEKTAQRQILDLRDMIAQDAWFADHPDAAQFAAPPSHLEHTRP